MIFLSDPMYRLDGRLGFSVHGFGKGSTPNRYTPHQGKRECSRRLRALTGKPVREPVA